jgi:hypothetical protein
MHGATIRYACGLDYVVGTGWSMDGETVDDEGAHAILADWWHAHQ